MTARNPFTRRERARCYKWISWGWGPGIGGDLGIKRLAHASTAIKAGDPFRPPPALMTDAERAADLAAHHGRRGGAT